jgi:hypothetical protein
MSVKSRLISLRMPQKGQGWYGDYLTWESAAAEAEGYAGKNIPETVDPVVMTVKEGKAAIRKGWLLFYEVSFNFPLLYFMQCQRPAACLKPMRLTKEGNRPVSA